MGTTDVGTEQREVTGGASAGARELGERLRPAIVAIDGPAASGKSTVGHLLAELLGYLFFDTGVMYRAVTWTTLERHLDIYDPDEVGALAESITIDVVPVAGEPDETASRVFVDGRNITPHIRSAAVDSAVSTISAHKRVRSAMSRQQRRLAQQYGSGSGDKAGVVMVGRDIGSVVIPEAPVKVYLDASAEERARRRLAELSTKGAAAEYDVVLADIVRRDGIDSNRALAPLALAEGATALDTTRLSLGEAVAEVLELVRQAAG